MKVLLNLLQRPFIRFCVVGGIGFIADALVFALCVELFGLPLLWARAISFVIAASVTWFGNRCFTFMDVSNGGASAFAQWGKFMLVACFAAIPNFAVFQSVLWLFDDKEWVPYLALLLGIIAGMLVNYCLSRRWVFSSQSAAHHH